MLKRNELSDGGAENVGRQHIRVPRKQGIGLLCEGKRLASIFLSGMEGEESRDHKKLT